MKGCNVTGTLNIVGKKWTFFLLEQIALEKGGGFNAISRNLKNVSPKILSQRLSDLEAAGIIEKRTINRNGRKTSYSLTPKGEDLCSIVRLLKKWSSDHSEIPCSQCINCPLY